MSPHELFTYIPDSVGEPEYWEGDPESPHIYGWGIDLELVDYDNPPNGKWDDWEEMHTALNECEINAYVWSDSSYVHADWGLIYPTSMELFVEPESVVPGRQDTYQNHPPDIIREINICGNASEIVETYPSGMLTIMVNEVPYSGGHKHIGRPMNHHPNPYMFSRATLKANEGEFYCEYEDPCQWGGQYFIRAIYQHGYHSYQVSDTLDILFNNLALVDSNESYVLLGKTDQHPINHYTLTDHRYKPLEIVERFKFLIDSLNLGNPETLWFNDGCLINGGRFDVGPTTLKPNWKLWGYPHREHRIGCSMDVEYLGINPSHDHYQILGDAIRDVTHIDPLAEGNHWHARFCQYSWE